MLIAATSSLALLFLITLIILATKYESKCEQVARLELETNKHKSIIKIYERKYKESQEKVASLQHFLRQSRRQKEAALRKVRDIISKEDFFAFMKEVE